MTSVTAAPENPLPFGRSRSRRSGSGRAIRWLRANLFNSVFNTILTVIAVYLLAVAVPPRTRYFSAASALCGRRKARRTSA